MQWLVDLFKEIPLASVLRERLRTAQDEIASLEARIAERERERDALARQLDEALAEIERLKSRRTARAEDEYDPLERF